MAGAQLVGSVCGKRVARTAHPCRSTGSIQVAVLQAAKGMLEGDFPSLAVPQSRPLSPGEVLGCTAPVLAADTDAIVFVADGRFHLEAIMIANPTVPVYRWAEYCYDYPSSYHAAGSGRAAGTGRGHGAILRAGECMRGSLMLG